MNIDSSFSAPSAAPTSEVTSVSVAELRLQHERGLRSIADLMVRSLNIRGVAIWDDTNNALVAAPSGYAASVATRALRATWGGHVAIDRGPAVLRSADGKERSVSSPLGNGQPCVCVELRTMSKRRRGAIAVVRENGADFDDVLPLLGDFAAAVEAQCELYTAAVSTRLALLEAAARASASRDFPNNIDLRGSLARFLPLGAVLIYDKDLRYLRAEGDLLNRFDPLSRESFQGATLQQLVDGPELERLERMYRDALIGGSQRLELRHRNRCYELQSMPIHDHTGAIVAGMLLVHDVTDSRALDARLRVAAQRIHAVTIEPMVAALG